MSLETETTVPSDPRSVFDTLTTPSDHLDVQNMVRHSMMDRQKEEENRGRGCLSISEPNRTVG